MERFEDEVLCSAELKPLMWRRYIDDTFILCKHGPDTLDKFHKHLNKQHPKIKFTREEEHDNKISFLDVLITRGDKFTTSVYRKPTNTKRYTPFFSHDHLCVKSGNIWCLAERARKICDQEVIQEEMKHLNNAFRMNGYPQHLITYNLREKEQTRKRGQEDKPPTLFLPYVQGISEKIEVACRKIGVGAVFKSKGTLRQTLTRVKSRTPALKKKLGC